MVGQKPGQVRTQDPGEQTAKIWLQNSARGAAIGAHQIENIACQRRQVATGGQGIENCALSLLHPLPVRAGDMRQDVVNMRMAPKSGDDEESEIADRDLPVTVGHPCDGLGYIPSVFGDHDRTGVGLSLCFDLLEHRSTYKMYIKYIL